MKTILVSTDFSVSGNNASQYAAGLAADLKATLILLHAYHVPVSSDVIVNPNGLDNAQKESEKKLNKLAASLKKKTGIKINCLTKMGFAVDEILDQEEKTDLIVMGMKSENKMGKIITGSVSTSILQKATIPVLIIPEKATYKKPKKIVFACDFDLKTNSKAIVAFKKIITPFAPEIYILNVKQKGSSEDIQKKLRTELENDLNTIIHSYYFKEKEDIIEGINEFTEEHLADLIVMIPHHHNLFEKLFHRSVSKKMAFQTHVPLLTLPDNHKTIPAYL